MQKVSILFSRPLLAPLFLLFAALHFNACSDAQSPAASRDFSGTWRVRYVPAVNPSDPPTDSHALWLVTVERQAFTAVVRYADTNYVPCNCPGDTLRGTVRGDGFFSGAAGNGSSVVQLRDSVYEILFSRQGSGTVGSGGIFTGEFRWLYAEGGDMPPGVAAGDLYKTWAIRGVK